MNDRSDILFFDELTPEQREALQATLARDPEWAQAFRRWQQVRAAVHERITTSVPDRRLLVLYALDAEGRTDVLSPAEQDELEEARGYLEQALAAHPTFADVVRRIQAERADFEAFWALHFEAEEVEGKAPEAGSHTRRRASDRRSISHAGRHHPLMRYLGRAAVVIGALAFVAVITFVLQRDHSMVTVTAPEGSIQVVELADGSTVRLDGGATLTYPDPDEPTLFDHRAVLTGRAFFEIVPAQQGFIVETPTATATVLGTSFSVTAQPEVTEVVLATGRLSLAPREVRDRFVVLEPGQMSRVTANALPSTPVEVELHEMLDWTNLFFFESTPVETIAEELSAYYQVRIEVAPALEGEAVTGTFGRDQAVEEILQMIAATLGAEVQTTPSGYVLHPPQS